MTRAEYMREYKRQWRREHRPLSTVNHTAESRPPDRDVTARFAEIPIDTRDLTARVFGDPLPGRSSFHPTVAKSSS